ncbi:hypothetical protein H311_02374 [Anncaliia algerae PRA109]|nr:hypothetical protein H311_02374 [Anncaliia algerae PRA109]
MSYFNIYREPETERSEVFVSDEKAISYLIESRRLEETKQCAKCDGVMRIMNSKSYLNTKVYYCKNRESRSCKSLFEDLKISEPRISISTYLLAVYKWIEKVIEEDIRISFFSLPKN